MQAAPSAPPGAGPAAHTGPCQGKAERMGLNVAAEQFPPAWGAVVKLGPSWVLSWGC